MTNSRTTKRALVSSALAIVLCLAMLIGSTFAWFTDTASTGVNRIQAGNLDVVLEVKENGEWVNAEGKTLTFKTADNRGAEKIFWEPGCTYALPELRIRNNGSLALKCMVTVNGIKSNAGSLAVDLNDAIEWTVSSYDGITYPDGAISVKAKAGASLEFKVSGHMKEEAGNEYQGLTISGVGITVVATQDTVESDSFGPDYDAAAAYPVLVSNQDELDEALNNAGHIALATGSFALDSTDVIGEGTTLAGQGKESTTLTASKLSVTKDDVTIKDMTIKGNAPAGNDGAVKIGGKNVVMENVKFVGQGFNGDTKGISVTGDDLTIRGCEISNAFRGIIFWDNIGGDNLIEDCKIDNVIYTFNINAGTVKPGTTLTVRNTTLNGWTSYSGCMEKVSFDRCELGKSNGYAYCVAYADSEFTKCTFNDGYRVAAGATGKTLIFTDCKLGDGTLITAANFAEKLGDVDDDLKGCTVIVNGTTVNWN